MAVPNISVQTDAPEISVSGNFGAQTNTWDSTHTWDEADLNWDEEGTTVIQTPTLTVESSTINISVEV